MIAMCLLLSGCTLGAKEATDATGSALDLQAQTNLRSVSTVGQAIAAETGGFTSITPSSLGAANESFTFVTAASTDPKQISVAANTAYVTYAARSTTGNCFYLRDTASGTTQYARSGGDCIANATVTFSDSW